MACNGAYASAWEYASFWCVGSILTGADDSGGAGNSALQDTQANFINLGVQANVGMRLYNTTQDTNGPITAVTATTMTATGVTWDDGDAYRVVTIDINEIATIEHYLNITSNNIHAARAASDGCDCTLASWAEDFLGKINIIEAGAFHVCPCGQPGQRMTDENRRLYLEWSNQQLENIRTQKIELCDGATGSEFPSVDWAEQSVTEFAAAQIIANREDRELA